VRRDLPEEIIVKKNPDASDRENGAGSSAPSATSEGKLRLLPPSSVVRSEGRIELRGEVGANGSRPGLRIRSLFAEESDGILVLDAATGLIVDANARLQAMLGKRLTELIGKALWEIGFVEDVMENHEALQRLQLTPRPPLGKLPSRSKNAPRTEYVCNAYVASRQEQIWCHVRETSEPASIERRDHSVTAQLLRLVFDLQTRERRMFDLANHDALTGLFNRRFLDDILERELCVARRRACSLTVAILDIDAFKWFNDSFGHEAGDLALSECARVLETNLRKGDIACRIGGDEFALVLPDSTPRETRPRLEQLCGLIEQRDLRHDGRVLGPMTASVGVAGAPAHAAHARGLLRAADAALYSAKRAGRNRVVDYEGPALA
jgi:diguanylate cyclase (GGDEF)-like protein